MVKDSGNGVSFDELLARRSLHRHCHSIYVREILCELWWLFFLCCSSETV